MTFKVKTGINVGNKNIIDDRSRYQLADSLPTATPTLNLDFVNQSAIDPRLTFTRTSSATYVGADGLIAYANTNEPRFENATSNNQPLGLLMEYQRINLALSSSKFDDTANWTPGVARVDQDVTVAAPDGSSSTYKITATGTSFPRVSRGTNGITAQTYCWSVYVKPGNVNYVHATFEIAGSQVVRFFGNLSTLATSSSVSYGTISCVPTLTPVGNGWYRFAGAITVTTAGNYTMYFGPASGMNTTAAIGDYIWAWGSQLEAGTSYMTRPSSYIPTVDTFSYRQSLASYRDSTDGLIKYAGFNILTYSNAFTNAAWQRGGNTTLTANADYAPDGTNTATRIKMPTGAGTWMSQQFTAVAGTTYIFSVYAKSTSSTPTLNLVFEPTFGAGTPLSGSTNITATGTWTRYSITYTAAASTTYVVTIENQGNNVAVDALIWGAQLEVGTTPTLYSSTASASSAAARPIYNPLTRQNRQWWFEPAATNLMPKSVVDADGWAGIGTITTINAATAPDGTTTAALSTVPAGGAVYDPYYNVGCTVSSSTVYTWSAYVKLGTMVAADYKFAVYDLTNSTFIGSELVPAVTPVNYEWRRITYTFTTPSTCVLVRPYMFRNSSTGAGGTVYTWGGQLEAGYVPSSYIPTTGSAATRSADVFTSAQTTRQYDNLVTNSTNWMNWNEGTFVVDLDFSDTTGSPFILKGSTSEYATIRAWNGIGTWNGTSQIDTFSPTSNVSSYASYAVSFNANGRTLMLNGGTANTGSGAFNTTPTTISFGGDGGGRMISGHMKNVIFYPTTMSNTQLLSLTRV